MSPVLSSLAPAFLAPAHAGHGSRAARHRGRLHYLLAADETGLAELEAVAALLPLCASGRAFIEVADASAVPPLHLPPRMTVTILDRSRRGGAPGSGLGCAPGEALARAVRGWSGEMVLAGDEDDVRVWLGGDYRSVQPAWEILTEERGVPAERITTPPVYLLGR